jgi:hypothetical protein
MSRRHLPKGPNGTWKTGQRCPTSGFWKDQHGQVNHFDEGATFPPCISWKGGPVAFRTLIRAAATA